MRLLLVQAEFVVTVLRACIIGGAVHRVAGLMVVAGVTACGGATSPRSAVATGYDMSPIAAAKLDNDASTRRRVLGMSFGEAAARVGSLAFDATATYRWSRGKRQLEQRDTFRVAQTPGGDFEVELATPEASLAFSLIGDDVYVRQNHDPVRKKPRRDVETGAWTETAFASLGQMLDLFGGRIRLSDPQPETLPERAAVRYRVALGPEVDPTRYGVRALLPRAPRARWREQANPLDLEGELWIDRETGVVLGLRLAGKIEIKDRDIRPTELSVAYDGRMSQVGKIARLQAPPHIDDWQRELPPGDVVSFFRQYLPPEPEDNASVAP